MPKRPSFQFYPGDWRSDTALQSCSVAARGLWHEMICLMHEGSPYGWLKVGSKVILPDNLARLVGATLQEVEGWLGELRGADVFSQTDGSIYSRRMVRDEELRQKRAAGGKLGGNPALMVSGKVNLKVGTEDNQIPTPSSSSSSSSPPSEERRVSSRLVGVAEPTADESPEKQAMTPEQIREADREYVEGGLAAIDATGGQTRPDEEPRTEIRLSTEEIKDLRKAKKRTDAEVARMRSQQARRTEMVWRINECWKAHLAQREKHWQNVEHRARAPGPDPALTSGRKKLIAEAILRLDVGLMGFGNEPRMKWLRHSKARAAGIGLFLDTWLTAEKEGNELHNGGRRFLEPERAWKIIKGVDNAERFAELYFEAKERQNG